MRTLIREKIYVCGDYLQVYAFPARKGKKGGRGQKSKATSAAMQKYNADQRAERLHRLILHNFTRSDISVQLSYAPKNQPATDEEALAKLRAFLRRLKRARDKKGLPPLKYIAVTEKGSRGGKYHHHVILSGGMNPDEVAQIWGMGLIQKYNALQFDTCGLVGLSRYLLKNPIGCRAYISSRNLQEPKMRTREGYISQRKCRALVINREDYREWENMYPGYVLAALPDATENEIYGGCYVRLRYIRIGAPHVNWWDELPDYDGKEVKRNENIPGIQGRDEADRACDHKQK